MCVCRGVCVLCDRVYTVSTREHMCMSVCVCEYLEGLRAVTALPRVSVLCPSLGPPLPSPPTPVVGC